MGVDRLLDMMRTAANANGDGVITMIVAHGEDNISMDVFNDPDTRTTTIINYRLRIYKKTGSNPA